MEQVGANTGCSAQTDDKLKLPNFPAASNTQKSSKSRGGQQQNTQPMRSSFKKNRTMRQNFDLSLNSMKMHELDLDELLECAEENIENTAFFASSVQLMGIIDSTINAIDERLAKKKSRIIGMPSTKNSNAAAMMD